MKVYDLLESIDLDKKVVQEEVLDMTADNDDWAQKYFSANYSKFMEHYKIESQQLVKLYNDFKYEFKGQPLPEGAQSTLEEIKRYLKFAQSMYRHPQLSEGVSELSENIKYALRKSWGDYPMYRDFITSLSQDMRRLYKR